MRSFFEPKGVAVVGASKDPGKAGHQILRNLLRLDFEGGVYPVNPKEGEILGVPCYKSLLDIPYEVELMISVIPAQGTLSVFEDAKKRGDLKAAVIVSAGFAETGDPKLVKMQDEVLRAAEEAGIKVMGPNCVGVMNTKNGLDTTFAPNVKQTQGIMSIITQSGSLGASILMFDGDQAVPLGFAKFAHVGNMADVDVLEILRFYKDDRDTKVICVYMEGLQNARSFMETAAEVALEKPLVVLKVGRTDLGAKAAFSHTGSLAGSDAVYGGAFEQSGVIRVDNIEELLDTARALALSPLPEGNRIAVLTEAGGMGITAMDALMEGKECVMADLCPETVDRLKEILPPMAAVNQPEGYVDMTAAGNEQDHRLALEAVLSDPGVDGVVLLSVPPTFLSTEKLAREILNAKSESPKPVLTCLMAGSWVKEAREILEQGSWPTFDMPDRAAKAMSNMVKRRRLLQNLKTTRAGTSVKTASIEELLVRAREGSTEILARRVLEAYELDTGKYAFAKTGEEAVEAAKVLGYPLAVKVLSPDIVHKSDAGGVQLGVENDEELKKAIKSMAFSMGEKLPHAKIHGYILTPMAEPGHEVIVGAVRDPQMGPVVMFGVGGVFVEILSDMVFKMAPVTKETALGMIGSITASQIFDGFRGGAPLDKDALADCLVKVSEIIASHPEIEDIELNPVRVYERGICVLDARLRVI